MPTTAIDSKKTAAKSGKRARKQATPSKAKPARASGNQRSAAPTTKTDQVLGLLRRARGVVPQNLVGRGNPGISAHRCYRPQHANDRRDLGRVRPRHRPEPRRATAGKYGSSPTSGGPEAG